ncbi:MAG: hypothetical protein DRP01_02555 [Archaeoglobales archaeon]|nr:MAG: hypothetical protein DRP01_02555 [Archaeoglobales archaeon]
MPIVCPRCGEKGYLVKKRVAGRWYWYVRHEEYRKGQRRSIRQCYLGPVDRYIYVERLNPLRLRGIVDTTRYLDYIESAITFFKVEISHRNLKIDKSTYNRLEKISKLLEETINEIKKQIS